MPREPRLVAVILAGGSGQRFWPLSREMSPKQLLTVFGTESLIAQAVHRVMPYVAPGADGIRIVTGERLFDELRNHLSAHDDARLRDVTYLIEPAPRNTAPAIALAAASIAAEDPEAVMIVLPSDHLLEDSPRWGDALTSASALARDGWLVTVGIRASRAEVGYGYIREGEALSAYDRGTAHPLRAAAFIEKPDAERAEAYAADGSYHWNAGIFVMRATRVLEELEATGDEGRAIVDVCRWLAARPREEWLSDEAIERFGAVPSASIDTAVMERSSRVAVIPADLTWSDVGSLLALGDVAAPDDAGNVRVGRGVDIDSHDNIVYSTDRLVATIGIRDLIVVDTSDATLVLPKDRAQDVRRVVGALKAIGAEEIVQPKVSLRPWGTWQTLLKMPGFLIKLIEVQPGRKLSLQYHGRRTETWVVVEGTASVTRGEETLDVAVNESVFIPMGATHRLENRGPDALRVIEVQVGDYVEEDDIVRVEDDWGREGR